MQGEAPYQRKQPTKFRIFSLIPAGANIVERTNIAEIVKAFERFITNYLIKERPE
jgi:hypothetical protein